MSPTLLFQSEISARASNHPFLASTGSGTRIPGSLILVKIFGNHKVFVSLVRASQDRFALMFKLLAQNPEFNRQFGEKIPKQKRFPRPNSVWAIIADEKSKENLNQWL